MSALTKARNTAVADNDYSNPFAAAGSGAGSTVYLKFSGATGNFTYGQDDEELPHGTTLAGDIEHSKWIWSFWWDGEVLETIEEFVARDPLGYENEPDHLPDGYDGDMTLEEIRAERADRTNTFMDGWSCQAVLNLREIGGEGTEYTLRLNAGVALNAFRALLNAFGRQYKFKVGLMPIVELSARSYKSKVKGVGKRWSPGLKITEWMSEEELAMATGEDPDMYDEVDDEPTPPARGKRGAPAEEEPSRTRRTAAALPPPDEDVAGSDDEVDEAEVVEDAPAARPQGRAARGRRGNNYG